MTTHDHVLRALRHGSALILALATVAPSSFAQVAVPDSAEPAAVATPVFTPGVLALAGGFAAAAFIVAHSDEPIADVAQDASGESHSGVHRAADALSFTGGPLLSFAGVGMYAAGRISHHRHLAELGLRTTEAIVVGTVATELIKGVVGRARPYASPENPGDVQSGRGFGAASYSSFPSGHTTVAFASATVLTAEIARWHPNALWYVAPLAFGGATAVGWSRIYNNEHWASDVVAGAGIGTLSGLLIVRWHEAHANNAFDRWLLPSSVSPVSGGAQVAWHYEF